jgi:hypothetical protein
VWWFQRLEAVDQLAGVEPAERQGLGAEPVLLAQGRQVGYAEALTDCVDAGGLGCVRGVVARQPVDESDDQAELGIRGEGLRRGARPFH